MTPADSPDVSVVVPMCNEAESVAELIAEICAALAGLTHEIVVIDDGSTDATPQRLREARSKHPALRLARHAQRRGQSAALCSGVRLARAEVIATMDGDGQDDATDLPILVSAFLSDPGLGLVVGHRRRRADSRWRRLTSRVANVARGRLLGDGTPDSGCGLKVFRRETFLAVPRFDHMHRFVPALVAATGRRVLSLPVGHRPRRAGASHYGTWDRLWVGLLDLAGVLWLMRRPCLDDAKEEETDDE